MAKILGLPKLSPTMEEGTLVHWAKGEGDSVEIDDLLAEVETDKATMEFRSFDKGVLLKVLVPEGTTLAPDQPVAILGNKGEDISSLLAEVGNGGAGSSQAVSTAQAPKESAASAPASRPAAVSSGSAAAQGPANALASGTSAPAAQTNGGRVLASPLVRRLAHERDIDLRQVSGSGPRGRVVKRDLEGARGTGPAAHANGLSTQSVADDRVVPLSSMRKTIARRLTESKQQIPHFYLTIDVDADPIWAARQQINAQLEKAGEKVSVNDLIIKAAALALKQVPEANASFLGDSIRYHGRVDISVAVAIPDGLVTPVVRHADQKGVLAISQEVRSLASRAKEKKLKPEEMSNGTFSISNLGMFGIEDFAAVINPPEGAILAVGSVREEPVVKNGNVVAGRRMRMTLSCDHRVVDGAVGAKWLAALRTLLEQPLSMLL